MGHGHFSPTAKKDRINEIIQAKGNHVDIPRDMEQWQYERKRQTIKEIFTEKYSFKARDKWLSDYEKLLGETRTGAQLREIRHPSGTTIYYYIVVEKNKRWNEPDHSNLAVRHTQTYYEELKQLLADLYGDVYTKTSAWTSQKIEVNA